MSKLFLYVFTLFMAYTAQADKMDPSIQIKIIGIGVVLEKPINGPALINKVLPNSPAEKAGLMSGDNILFVRSHPNAQVVDVSPLPLDNVVAQIRGPLGVPVELTIIRGNSETLFFSITREEFEISE